MVDHAGSDARRLTVDEILREASTLLETVRGFAPAQVLLAADMLVSAFESRNKVLVFGNGGSASDAEHLAAELVGRFAHDRQGWPAISLTADSSVVTAIGNDYGFDQIFARQVDALGRQGDIAFAISTSGKSANVIAGLEAAERGGLRRIALTGRDGGLLGRAAELQINVPHDSVPRVQEVHRTLLHVICELVERELAG
ncbi:MAG: SIS domain-containing protein [Vicinamibacterales bacterium]|jgi:D-sedoheptulose 7-phosphate isomerase|nr:phosphoheptose isomerase [Acidobacteriota bacterium]MDP7211783.1 SIS domain-containing protein [Vicinamibacterales bacterium]HJO17538.1 SIS domain-containing protein [Vicinamibacterales bacterium]|tara:strand:+ start:2308 stop:2904 length:597 start_codon:yes stop_codon:yes gene_type:complete